MKRLRAITSVDANLPSILHKKNYFFYFTHLFLQNTHISLSILHIYSIKYSSFYHFSLFSPSRFSLTDPIWNSKSTETQTHLPQNNSLSLTNPNHHHTNLKILAPTKHSFITLFIASSLYWVPKVDPPLLWLRRLIGEALVHHVVHRIFMLLQWVPTRISESRRRQRKSAKRWWSSESATVKVWFDRRQWRHGLTGDSGESESKWGKGVVRWGKSSDKRESGESESESRDKRERKN